MHPFILQPFRFDRRAKFGTMSARGVFGDECPAPCPPALPRARPAKELVGPLCMSVVIACTAGSWGCFGDDSNLPDSWLAACSEEGAGNDLHAMMRDASLQTTRGGRRQGFVEYLVEAMLVLRDFAPTCAASAVEVLRHIADMLVLTPGKTGEQRHGHHS